MTVRKAANLGSLWSRASFALLALCLLTLAIVLATGCVHHATGPAFSVPASPQPGKALVYFYRSPGEKWGYDRTYPLIINDEKVTAMLHGGFYPYESPAGHLRVIAGATPTPIGWRIYQFILIGAFVFVDTSAWQEPASLDLDVEAGHVYFIKLQPEIHANHFSPRLFPVTRDVGESEITACRLIQRAE